MIFLINSGAFPSIQMLWCCWLGDGRGIVMLVNAGPLTVSLWVFLTQWVGKRTGVQLA